MRNSIKYLLLALLVCCATTAFGQKYPERRHVRKGNSLYEEQRMEEAQKEYRTALQEDAKSVEGKFNLGDSQFAMGDFESAENTFKELLAGGFELSDEQKAKTHYNLGNAQFQQQKLEEALESYKSSLRLNPSDMEAKFNYAYTKAMMENQQNQDQQNNQQNNDQNQQQQGDNSEQNQNRNDEQEQPQDQQGNQPEQPEGDKPEPSEGEQEPREAPQPSPESEQMLDAVQAAEDKTKDKVDAERVVGVGRSGKNW